MNIITAIFYFFEATAAVSAIGIVFSRSLFYAALLLIVCLLSVSGLYVLAFAEFIAVTQIMVYAGGVLVLIIFGIMLTSKIGKETLSVEHGNLISGSAAALALLLLLCYHISFVPKQQLHGYDQNTIEVIGTNLMTSHLLPFELAGMLLLVSLIGAAVIASQKSKEA
jgi:NADH:ubiquinone oxidoreductase subunit 6 (subunit J)